MLLLTTVVLVTLLASGAALAINTIHCKIEGPPCRGTNERDRLLGNERSNRMFGRGGGDILRGYGDWDDLHGERGNDRLYGGEAGDHYFFSSNNWGKDTIADTLMPPDPFRIGDNNWVRFYRDVTTSLTINLVSDSGSIPEVTNAAGTSTINWSGNVIDNVSNRSPGNDSIVGNSVTNWIISSGGNDTISTGGGDDFIEVQDGAAGDSVDCGEDAGDDDAVFYDTGDTLTNCETLFQ